jgi:hypothetical protein
VGRREDGEGVGDMLAESNGNVIHCIKIVPGYSGGDGRLK